MVQFSSSSFLVRLQVKEPSQRCRPSRSQSPSPTPTSSPRNPPQTLERAAKSWGPSTTEGAGDQVPQKGVVGVCQGPPLLSLILALHRWAHRPGYMSPIGVGYAYLPTPPLAACRQQTMCITQAFISRDEQRT